LSPPGELRLASISAVLPAYNEEEVIAQTVAGVDAALTELVDDFEIIVVDDGSRDATPDRLAELRSRFPRLRVKTHADNRGYGAALSTGFSAATKDLLFVTDGDKQFDVGQLKEFLPLPDDVDLYIGYRHPRADPWIRCLFGWAWNELVYLLFGHTARDVDCAFKLLRTEVWARTQVRATGSSFSPEFVVKARRLGFRLRERPVRHYPPPAGTPTGAHPAVIARALKELVRLRIHLNRELARTESWHRAATAASGSGISLDEPRPS